MLKEKIDKKQKEVLEIEELKTQTQVAIKHMKQQIISEAEEFSIQLASAKQIISAKQENSLAILLETLINSKPSPNKLQTLYRSLSTDLKTHEEKDEDESRAAEAEIKAVLSLTPFKSIEELLKALQKEEDNIFTIYTETQDLYKELEEIDNSNRELEKYLAQQVCM